MRRRGFLLAVSAAALSCSRERELALDDTPGVETRFLLGSRLLFAYRYSSQRPKTYVHPLCAPDGAVVTRDGPKDHIHHRGLMLAWSGVDGIDFWGEDNPARHGQIVQARFETPVTRGVRALLDWQAEGRVLLTEVRTITAPAQTSQATLLDWESVLTAPEAVRLGTDGHVYDGLGVRVAESMDLGDVLNSNGTRTIEKANGEPANWCAYTGNVPSGKAGIAIFDHPENPRHPTPFFVMNDKFGYLSAAPSFREDFFLQKGEQLRFRWRVAVWNGIRNQEQLDQMYKAWSSKRDEARRNLWGLQEKGTRS